MFDPNNESGIDGVINLVNDLLHPRVSVTVSVTVNFPPDVGACV